MAEDLELDEIRAQALITVGMARYDSGDDEGRDDVQRGLEIALASNHLAAAARGYQNLAVVTKDPDPEVELLQASADLWLRLGNTEGARYAQANRAGRLFEMGRWDESQPLIDAFISDCEAGRPHYQEAVMRSCRAWARLVRDDADGALEDLERSVAVAREAKDPQALFGVLGDAALVFVKLDRLEEARTVAREIVAASPEAPRWSLGFILAAERLEMGDAVRSAFADEAYGHRADELKELAAEGRLIDAAEVAAGQDEAELAALLRVAGAEALLEDGRAAEAAGQFEQALAFYRSVGGTRAIREIQAQLAAIHSNVS